MVREKKRNRLCINVDTIQGTCLTPDDIYAFISMATSEWDINCPYLVLEYDMHRNRFTDECGFPVDNIWEFITPNEYQIFISSGVSTLIAGWDYVIVLIHPLDQYD